MPPHNWLNLREFDEVRGVFGVISERKCFCGREQKKISKIAIFVLRYLHF